MTKVRQSSEAWLPRDARPRSRFVYFLWERRHRRTEGVLRASEVTDLFGNRFEDIRKANLTFRYKYSGRNSEGNRFIRHGELSTLGKLYWMLQIGWCIAYRQYERRVCNGNGQIGYIDSNLAVLSEFLHVNCFDLWLIARCLVNCK